MNNFLEILVRKDKKKDYRRLICYKQQANQVYWDKFWSQISTEDFIGDDPFLEKTFQEYVSKSGKVLENGCGLCQHVKVLSDMGYDVEGLDFSKLGVVKGKQYDSNLSLSVGDVLSLPYKNGAFSSCISLGVVEHFENGPESAIQEMARILSNGGFLLISVPYFNILRKIASYIMRHANDNTDSSYFYQFVFSAEEFDQILRTFGLTPVKMMKYGSICTLKEIPLIRFFYKKFQQQVQKPSHLSNYRKRPRSSFFKSLILTALNSKLVSHFVGHMILFVCQKNMYKDSSKSYSKP